MTRCGQSMRKTKSSLFDVLYQRPCGLSQPTDLFTTSKNCRGFVQRLSLSRRLAVHAGCVNSIWWNSSGTLLLSGSDDHHLKLTEPDTGKVVVNYKTEHRGNIFSAKFLPFSNDSKIVSCSGDGAVLYTDLQDSPVGGERPAHMYLCPAGTTYEVLTWTEPHCFLSCGEEGGVRYYDLRQHRPCQVRGCVDNILVSTDRAVTTMALNPAALWELAVGTADGYVRLYDRRMTRPRANVGAVNQWTAPGLHGTMHRITAMRYSDSGCQLLVSYSADDVYLFDLSSEERRPPAAGPGAPPPPPAGPPRPPVKRLRLRGDWSDTGPQARPERHSAAAAAAPAAAPEAAAEQRAEPPQPSQPPDGAEHWPRRAGISLHANLINQMSDVLQRLLTSEMPARPEGPSAGPVPDLSGRPVTRRVMERIRQRRALNMEQMVQGIADLHTSQRDAEPAEASSGGPSGREENGAASGAPPAGHAAASPAAGTAAEAAAASGLAPSGQTSAASGLAPSDQTSAASGLAPSGQTSAASGPAPSGQTSAASGLAPSDQTSSARSAPLDLTSSARSAPTEQTSAVGPAPSDQTSAVGPAPSDQTSPVGPAPSDQTSAVGPAPSDQTSPVGPTPSDQTSAVGPAPSDQTSPVGPAPCDQTQCAAPEGGTGGDPGSAGAAGQREGGPGGATGAAGGGTGADAALAPCPLGPYMDLETQSVVVRSEPLVSLYYNPQSSTAGQISVDSPPSRPDLVGLDASGERGRRTTFAERAVLLSCDSAQEPDGPGPEPETKPPDQYTASDSQPRVYRRYTGHRNARTMIKEAGFWGDNYVMSGSDCGHVFIWDKHAGHLVTILEADRHVVNCVQPHPLDPVLATSGIDYDIKLWAPLAEQATFDRYRAEELMSRNEVMLEETRDTITVPASFMIRMLASLSSRRARQSGDDS